MRGTSPAALLWAPMWLALGCGSRSWLVLRAQAGSPLGVVRVALPSSPAPTNPVGPLLRECAADALPPGAQAKTSGVATQGRVASPDSRR